MAIPVPETLNGQIMSMRYLCQNFSENKMSTQHLSEQEIIRREKLTELNNMGIDAEAMRNIRKKFNQSAIIAICQNTKDGKVRGSYEIMHDSDMIVKVADGMAVTIKNRFKEKNMSFDVFEVLRRKDSKIIPINRNKGNDDSGMDTDLRNTI